MDECLNYPDVMMMVLNVLCVVRACRNSMLQRRSTLRLLMLHCMASSALGDLCHESWKIVGVLLCT